MKKSKVEDRESNASASGFPPVIEVSAGLVFRSGKLLITQRHADAHLGGLWEFPGGKREAGETFEECLVRELREELGIEVEVGKVFESLSHAYTDKTVQLKFFFCRLIEGNPRPLDCAALKWVTCEELVLHEFPAADEQLLARLAITTEFWHQQ